MKFLSSTVILSALALSWVTAEDPMPSVGADTLRQASLPTAKSIKRRTDAPVVEQPKPIVPPPRAASQAMYQQPKQQHIKTEQQRTAGMPKFEDNDFVKRLTTEMEDFERDWAARRGAKVPPKQPQQANAGAAVPPSTQAQRPRQATAPGQQPKQPLFNEDMLKMTQNMAKNVDMDALLNQTGLKDVIAPIAESVKGGNAEDIKKGVRELSQQLFGNPDKVQGLMDSPEVKQIMDKFVPSAAQPAGEGQKRQPTIADLLKDLTAPAAAAGADGSTKAPGLDGLDDLFGSLFGGSPNANKAAGTAGKKQTGGWEDLFGDIFNSPPPTTVGGQQKKNSYTGQKHPYGYDSSDSYGKPKYGSQKPQYKNTNRSFSDDDSDWSTGEL